MKFISLLFILFTGSQALAESWYALGADNAYGSFNSKALCEERQKDLPNFKGCFDVAGKDPALLKIEDVDDENKPIYRDPNESEVKIECDNPEDCQEKMMLRDGDGQLNGTVCTEHGLIAKYGETNSWASLVGLASDYFIWCEKVSSFQKKKAARLDPDKVAAAEAAKAKADQIAAMAKAGGEALVVGAEAKKIMVGMIRLKKLPKAQRKALRGDLKSIIEALGVGSIDIAIDEIKALPEDGVVVTPGAKATILEVFAASGYSIE